MYDILIQNASVIDAAGLVPCPGFIDSHSHGDSILGTKAGQLCKTNQGITTELIGQFGMTTYPVSTDPENDLTACRTVRNPK